MLYSWVDERVNFEAQIIRVYSDFLWNIQFCFVAIVQSRSSSSLRKRAPYLGMNSTGFQEPQNTPWYPPQDLHPQKK